ncbi:sphingosine-1-phosphate lyase [Anoplophora glabripennis]|uniref:sphingosine-1-phosphate lyase n=1 Tax=Anoplophora glabripennis TaxID=217634 RepID=UPI000873B27B|nr:sphingosine-1-phosphate lyase [Anoplophora glabripennis]
MDIIRHPVSSLKFVINDSFNGKEPWQIVTITTTTIFLGVWFYDFLFQDESIIDRGKKTVFRLAKLIPSIKKRIDDELSSISKNFKDEVEERTKHTTYITELPHAKLSKKDIIEALNTNLGLGDYDWKNGLVSGAVYYYSPDLIDVVSEVYSKTSYTNPLHSDLFPGLCKMEAEVVRIAADLFNGNDDTCGTMTSGGTESIIMACKAYRDYGREVKGIKKPEIIVPTTVHSAFDKAAQYLKLRVRSVRTDPNTCQVDVNGVRKAINSNTIMIVGSAPNFPYGTMDDIPALSELGVKYNIPVHVDSCLGGFLTCFMEDAGYPIPPCDFRLPGVTSISADTHKYGFTPKGSSVVLYRDVKYRHHQYTVTTDWPGGVYGSPTVSGSRAGGNIAVCWATLLNFGREGYVSATRDIVHTTKYIEKGLRRMKGIFIFGQPVTSVIALGSNDFHIYRLSTALKERGWNLNVLQFPSGIHICVTHMHTQPGVADRFLNDVRDSLFEIMKNPSLPVEGKMAIYGVAQELPDRSIVGDFTKLFLDSTYYVPKRGN